MEEKHKILISIPIVIVAIIGFLGLALGFCSFLGCTTIEVISHEVTEPASYGQLIVADFVVRNIGEETAENCFVNWRFKDSRAHHSERFSLSPQEETKIHFQKELYEKHFDEFHVDCLTSPTLEVESSVRILCENTDLVVRKNFLFNCES